MQNGNCTEPAKGHAEKNLSRAHEMLSRSHEIIFFYACPFAGSLELCGKACICSVFVIVYYTDQALCLEPHLRHGRQSLFRQTVGSRQKQISAYSRKSSHGYEYDAMSPIYGKFTCYSYKRPWLYSISIQHSAVDLQAPAASRCWWPPVDQLQWSGRVTLRRSASGQVR